MDSKLIKNILVYGIGDFIVTGVSAFLLIPLYLHFLSPSEYGLFNIINNNTALITYIFQFGIISAFSRIYFLKKHNGTEQQYINGIVVFHIIYSIILFLTAILFRKQIFHALSPSLTEESFCYFSVIMSFLSFLPALYYIILRMEEVAITFVKFQILTVVLLLTCLGTNALFFKVDLHSFLKCFLIAYVIIWLLASSKFLLKFSKRFSFSDIKETLYFAFPIFLGYISYFLMTKYSLVILQKYIPLKEIGFFSLAQQVAAVPTYVSIAISKAIQPYVFSSNTDNEVKAKAQQVDNVYKVFIIWLTGALLFSVEPIFTLFLPARYSPVIEIAQLFLFITLVYNFTLIENSILLYKMKSKTLLIITIVGSSANIILSNLLVKRYLIKGVLISMLIAYVITFTMECIISRRYLAYKYDLPKIIGGLLILVIFISLTQFKGLILVNDIFINAFRGIGFLILTVILFSSIKKTRLNFGLKINQNE